MAIWSAEQTIDREMARKAIAEQFPELNPINIDFLGHGWDNTAFLVNEDLVFRFPRRMSAVQLLEKEVRILPRLAARLPLQISHPIYIGRPSSHFPWPFAGYRFVPGTTACDVTLEEIDGVQLAVSLARFLKELHALVPSEMDLDLPDDEQGILKVGQRIPKIEANLEIVREHALIASHLSFDDILSSADDAEPETSHCIVHADLYARHLIMNEKGHFCGIIDWGEVHRNDPAVDLAIVFQLIPAGAARERFWQEYGTPRQSQLRLARFSALDHLLTILRYGHEVGDADLIRVGEFGIQCVLVP